MKFTVEVRDIGSMTEYTTDENLENLEVNKHFYIVESLVFYGKAKQAK